MESTDLWDASEILNKLRMGGKEELSRLFMQLRPSIRNMIASRIHGKLLSRLDASDIVQETFIRANNTLEKYLDKPTIHPAIWLRTLGKQMLAEMIRRQFRLKRTPELETIDLDHGQMVGILADSLESVGQRAARGELVERVRELLSQVSETDREILELRHAEGYTFQEIGDLLNVQMEAAKKRYYRAIDRFRILSEPELGHG